MTIQKFRHAFVYKDYINYKRKKKNYSRMSIVVVKTEVYNSRVCSSDVVQVVQPISPPVARVNERLRFS